MRISPPFAAGPAAGRVWLSIADLSWGGHQPGSHMLWPRCWAVRRRRTGRQWPQQHSSWSPKTRSKNYAIQTSFYSRCFFFPPKSVFRGKLCFFSHECSSKRIPISNKSNLPGAEVKWKALRTLDLSSST